MNNPTFRDRTFFVSSIAALLIATTIETQPATAADVKLQVVTSYPEELTTRFERAFERLHPDIDVQFVWKQARDAMTVLDTPDHGGIDVYWSPSLDNFPALAAKGSFRPIAVDRSVLPGRIGPQPISDPNGRYEAFEVAGYGIALSPARLTESGLARPTRWRDLASPAWAGKVSLPQPVQRSFSPALYDVILQSEGWVEGWALLSEISGNASFATVAGAPTFSDPEDRAAATPTIDFFVRAAMANGAAVDFVYPRSTAFLPAWIAVLTDAPHREAAEAFYAFALSREGQELVGHRDIGRIPVRTDVGDASLRETLKSVAFAYDFDLGRARRDLVVDLFDVTLVAPHVRDVALWRAIHAAEAALATSPDPKKAEIVAAARRAAGFVPLSAADAASPARLAALTGDTERKVAKAKWLADVTAARDEAARLLASAGFAP